MYATYYRGYSYSVLRIKTSFSLHFTYALLQSYTISQLHTNLLLRRIIKGFLFNYLEYTYSN